LYRVFLAFQRFLEIVRKLVDEVPESEVKNAKFANIDGIKKYNWYRSVWFETGGFDTL